MTNWDEWGRCWKCVWVDRGQPCVSVNDPYEALKKPHPGRRTVKEERTWELMSRLVLQLGEAHYGRADPSNDADLIQEVLEYFRDELAEYQSHYSDSPETAIMHDLRTEASLRV